MSGEVATCAVMHTYTSKISESSESIIYPLFGMQQQQPPRLTWTRTHQYVVWCCPDESDAGSCICHGPPSHSRHGSGHWGSFYSRRQLLPARCSGTEREQRWQMNNNKKNPLPWESLGASPPALPAIPRLQTLHCPQLLNPFLFGPVCNTMACFGGEIENSFASVAQWLEGLRRISVPWLKPTRWL